MQERLSRIESITDAALTHLRVEELLDELLARLRELLDVDTAAVLLLDRGSNDLVATRASGLEEEVRQGVRVPLGAGFAGRIGVERAPVIIDDVDDAEIWNPILREIGIKSLLGVPLLADGELVGVLHVGSLTGRRFDSHDVDVLERVADRVGLALAVHRSNVEQAAAGALQRSLIPGRLPAISGLEIAARYLPGGSGGVGGDWYDVFPLPTGEVGFVIGDVVGRGLDAAVVMGRLRSALRAYALDSLDPAEVLRRLDRKLQHFEAGHLTTAVYGVCTRSLDTVQLSIAGHLRPVLVSPDGSRRVVDAVVDPPLGVAPVPRHSSSVELAPGELLAVFTDGLVERRGESIENRLTKLTGAFVAGSAERSCASAVATMLGGSGADDDAAILVLRREDASRPLRLRLPAVARSLGMIRTALRRWLPPAGVGEDTAVRIVLAVGEVSANVVEHAYGPAGGDLTIEASIDETGQVLVSVSDRGRWRTSRGTNRGRGLGIIEQCATKVEIDRGGAGTTVHLTFDQGKDANDEH